MSLESLNRHSSWLYTKIGTLVWDFLIILVYFLQDMLTRSRAADSGIKLEVNEKILDSCTTLMQAIRLLVQKSKFLQAEIIGQGRVSNELII